MMGGQIDWAAIPIITEIMGIVDVQAFIRQLIVIRDFQREQNE